MAPLLLPFLISIGLATFRNHLVYGGYFEAMSAMRESFTTLQMLRVVPTNSPNKYHSQLPSLTGSDCVTPYSSGNVSPRFQKGENQEGEDETDNDVDKTNGRRLSWHSDMDNGL
ncbi:hypothetical protein Tco_0980748 [Tanacetum coccineum]